MKLVSAKDHSIAAGRDVNITVKVDGDRADLVKTVLDALGIEAKFAQALLEQMGDQTSDEKTNGIIMVARSSAVSSKNVYEKHFADERALHEIIKAAVGLIRSQNYIDAHKLFGKALIKGLPEAIKSQALYDYFVSGYVAYSLRSDTDSIRDVITEMRESYSADFTRDIDLSIAEAHQEIATRQTSDEMLFENKEILDELMSKYGDRDVQCLNLLGLLRRRLGERPSLGEHRLAYLASALEAFTRIQTLQQDGMSVEARNNWAITLVRHFELTNEFTSLDQAESILSGIDFNTPSVALSDFLALPKALNNLGNVFKQRLIHTGQSHWLSDAIEQYNRTERFWSEDNTPYEWAMIQKNKADVRCAALKIRFDQRTAELALQEIERSMKYRSAEKAPYQYQKSLVVKNRLEELLREHRPN